MTDQEAGVPNEPFPAGVVEGFYGPPWSHDERIWMIRFIASLGMNHYIYAPKDDPLHREQWRDPYGPEDTARFNEAARVCAEVGVTFNLALSPGLSIAYTDRRDRRLLVEKYLAIAEQGARAFSLFLDDIPPWLRGDADRAAYREFGSAHADLANETFRCLARELGDDVELLFCPTEYAGMEPSPYLESLGAGLDRRIPVFWTGPRVVSPTITCSDARAFGALIGRKPYLWDNYPVNDFAPNRLFLGPLRGREPGLEKELAGYSANPMNQARASQVALRTLAAWLADSTGYDPDAAWPSALDETMEEAAGQDPQGAPGAPSTQGAPSKLRVAFRTVAPLFRSSRLEQKPETPLSPACGAAAEVLLAAAGEIGLLTEIAGWLRDVLLRCRTVLAADDARRAVEDNDRARAREIAEAAWPGRMLVGRRHRLATENEMHRADGKLVPLLRESGEFLFDSDAADRANVIDAGKPIETSMLMALHAKPWMKPRPEEIPGIAISQDGKSFEPLDVEARGGCAVARPGSRTFRYIRIDAAEGCGIYLLVHRAPSDSEETPS